MLFRKTALIKAQRGTRRRKRKLRQRYTNERSPRVERLEGRQLLATAPILDYAFSIGGDEVEQAYDMTRDADGHIYVAGDFFGTVDFDPGPVNHFLTPVTGQDAFVAKYTSAGSVRVGTATGNDKRLRDF